MYNKQTHEYEGINKSKQCNHIKYSENGDFAYVCPECGRVFRFTGKIGMSLNYNTTDYGHILTAKIPVLCKFCNEYMISVDPNIAKALAALYVKNIVNVNSLEFCREGKNNQQPSILILDNDVRINQLDIIPDGWYIKKRSIGLCLESYEPDLKNRIATLNKWALGL